MRGAAPAGERPAREELSVPMKIPVREWLLAVVLVPAVFVLALGAVLLAAGIGPQAQLFGPHRQTPPEHAPVGPFVQPDESAGLIIRATVPPAPGRGPVRLTVRITTVPPMPRPVVEAAGGYLAALLGALVTTLPADWTTDAAGLAALKHAIEESAPIALAPSLPAGTQVTVFADVAVSPEPPSP